MNPREAQEIFDQADLICSAEESVLAVRRVAESPAESVRYGDSCYSRHACSSTESDRSISFGVARLSMPIS
jgi:hypothetical protein